MTTTQFAFAGHPAGHHDLRVTAVEGEEALNRPFRFEIGLSSREPSLSLDAVGGEATLCLAGREIRGIVAEFQQMERDGDGFGFRVVLVPRIGRLALASRSRVFRDLTLPQIATAVAAAAGVDVHLRLTRAYAVVPFVVQYRETDLAFVSRLLEAEGIAFHTQGDDLVLSDSNDAFDTAVPARFVDEHEGAEDVMAPVRAFRCTRAMMPRGVLLHDVDPRANVPLEGRASVDPHGFGVQVEDGMALLTAEHGQGMAKRRAEGLRAQATRYDGRTEAPLAPGQRLVLDGHFRPDFNRDYVVVSATHAFDGSQCHTQFEAIAGDTVFRPALCTPRPRIDGVMRAVVDSDVDETGRYEVALPFDLSSHGSRPVALVSPDEGTRFMLHKGAAVVLDFIDGDPSRPLIAGTLPRASRGAADTNVIRAPQGAIIEMSGTRAPRLEGEHHDTAGRLAELRAHSGEARRRSSTGEVTLFASGRIEEVQLSWSPVENADRYELTRDGAPIKSGKDIMFVDTGLVGGTVYQYELIAYAADGSELASSSASATPTSDLEDAQYGEESSGQKDWMRFAVPHGDGKWSYLRYGEAAERAVFPPDDESQVSFREDPVLQTDSEFTSKYFSPDGDPEDNAENRTKFTWATLDDDAYDTNGSDDTASTGRRSYFGHGSSAGVFDYTDANRTTITRGDHQSVTEGHRTDVILGDYRLVIPCRTDGVYDADTYWMRYRRVAGSWRKTERSHVSSDSITWGDTEEMHLGTTVNGFLGTNIDVSVGATVDAFAGMSLEFGAGLSAKYDIGHSYEWVAGTSAVIADDCELTAYNVLKLTVLKEPQSSLRMTAAAGALALVTGGLVATTSVFASCDEPVVAGAVAIPAALAFAATLALARKADNAKPSEETDPSIVITDFGILLKVGSSSIEIHEDAIWVEAGGTQLEVSKNAFAISEADASVTGEMHSKTLKVDDSAAVGGNAIKVKT